MSDDHTLCLNSIEGVPLAFWVKPNPNEAYKSVHPDSLPVDFRPLATMAFSSCSVHICLLCTTYSA